MHVVGVHASLRGQVVFQAGIACGLFACRVRALYAAFRARARLLNPAMATLAMAVVTIRYHDTTLGKPRNRTRRKRHDNLIFLETALGERSQYAQTCSVTLAPPRATGTAKAEPVHGFGGPYAGRLEFLCAVRLDCLYAYQRVRLDVSHGYQQGVVKYQTVAV